VPALRLRQVFPVVALWSCLTALSLVGVNCAVADAQPGLSSGCGVAKTTGPSCGSNLALTASGVGRATSNHRPISVHAPVDTSRRTTQSKASQVSGVIISPAGSVLAGNISAWNVSFILTSQLVGSPATITLSTDGMNFSKTPTDYQTLVDEGSGPLVVSVSVTSNPSTVVLTLLGAAIPSGSDVTTEFVNSVNPTLAGQHNMSVSTSTDTQSASGEYQISPSIPSTDSSKLTAVSTVTPGTAGDTYAVTIFAGDQYDNPLPGASVQLSQNAGSHSSISGQGSGTAGMDGTAAFTVFDAVLENVTYTADIFYSTADDGVFGSRELQTTVSFFATPGDYQPLTP
jgi:hypothetical protein